ncbi:shikimate dehydrogenase [Ideonella sp. B508-1]|uniref:shikimate dehydrogenase family protein n=1 Tax=Ideonella sp. B508-1 TaxID=137716 RepID=UPI000477DA67|nr:shikimate dehydrogenase [Ideonella sp. B508-1]
MINGNTELIAHIGFPTRTFKSPMIYNPWFAAKGINAVVVPMGSQPDHFPTLFQALRGLTNLRGALITMPHKVSVMDLVDELTPTARVAGACNAVLRRPDGRFLGDQFDGAGFVRGILRKGFVPQGRRALITGTGGVGSAIAASLAATGLAELALHDLRAVPTEALAARLREHHPALRVTVGSNDPAGFDLIVNATPLGMNEGDPLPFDMSRVAPGTWAGEVVMHQDITPFLAAALARGCTVQQGKDMLFEMIPAYLEFFGYGSATPEELRAVARFEAETEA